MKGQSKESKFGSIKIALISAFGNWIGDMILYPLDTISTRLKANKHFNPHPWTYSMQCIKNDGLGLYRGFKYTFPASFLPTFVYVAVYDLGMRFVERTVHHFTNHNQVKLLFPFFVSSVAEILSLVFYIPVDTVRTRVQINRPEYSYTSFRSGIREILQREGKQRFFKSSKVYFLCKTLYTAIQFQSFEMIRYYLGPSTTLLIFNTVISTAIATTFLNPLQVLITRYALIDTAFKKIKISRLAHSIYQRQGFIGFYKGYGTQLVLHVLYALFWIPLYQVMREKYGIQMPQ